MAQILKADFSAVHHLKQQKEALERARSKRSSRLQWFSLGAAALLLMPIGVYLVHGRSLVTVWALEGYLLVLTLWWMSLLVPVTLEVLKIERQLESVRSGLEGEMAVGRTLAGLPDSYIVLHDVTVMSDESNRTQLDHVVISPELVLCIETKNWHGTYYPGRCGWMWKSLERLTRSKKHAHKDPVEQSHMHKAALKRLLDSAGLPADIRPVVVLSDPESTWQGKQSDDCPVLRKEELLPYIESLGESKENEASKRQREIAEAILTLGKGETTNEDCGASAGRHACTQ